MKCLNSIVFYDNRDEVEQYITEVAEISDGLVDLAVVVNSDREKVVGEMVADLREKGINCFRVIDYKENIGYLNTLMKTVRETESGQYDYYILSNTDIHYKTRDFFQKLQGKTYPADVGCIAPDVYNPGTQSYSNPHYMERIPKAKLERLVKLFRHPIVAKTYIKLAGIKNGKTKAEKKSSCYVYSPHGCYMIFTREFIKRIWDYEYGVKLYSEESAIGELLIRNGMKCYYDDSISVIHDASTVTGKINRKTRFNAWRESLEYIIKEFY